MPNYGMGFKSFIKQVDDKTLSKTRRKMNKRSHKGRHYGLDSADAMAAGAGGMGESAALPATFGADVRASASYGQGLGFNPDTYPEQEEDGKDQDKDFSMEDENKEEQDDFSLDDEGGEGEDDFNLDDEGGDEGDMNRQGVVRTIDNAHMIYKKQNEEGTYDELWIYNTGADMKDELEIRRNILAGTDIPANRTKSEDGTQVYTLTSLGNAQYLQIRGLPN